MNRTVRATIELDDALLESVRRLARRENLSMARMLGKLVEQELRAAMEPSVPTVRSGRFNVIAPSMPEARVSSERVRKVIDGETSADYVQLFQAPAALE